MIQNIVKATNNVDFKITKWIHENIGLNKNPLISKAPYFLGLLPYELYVIPGMFIAIFTMFYDKSFNPIQFHLLPHWFAFSVATYMKHNIDRVRPGCLKGKGLDKLIDPKHCLGGTMHQSFPSGHTIIAVALATTLYMYLSDSTKSNEDKTFLGIPFYDPTIKLAVVSFGFFVAAMTALHRVSFGYHHFSDVCLGALLGYAIGYSIYSLTNICKAVDVKEKEDGTKEWHIIQVAGMALSSVALLHFFMYKFSDLSEIQH